MGTSPKEILLNWCKQKITGYAGVNVTDFGNRSWKDGLAMGAILNRYYPRLIDFDSLSKATPERNLKIVFDAAESVGIPKLMEANDLIENSADSDTIMAYVSSMYQRLEKGEDTTVLKRESQAAKEKLKNVQTELASLQQKLLESRQAMKEKEMAKKKLERTVETLKIQLGSEKKTQSELENEYNQRIDKLQKKLETAAAGEKAALLQKLKEEREVKETLLKQQSDIEREMGELKKQLKDEEKKAQQLEEETKRKEEEKRNLDKIHKEKMKELKKKLLDIFIEQESTNRKIGWTIQETAKLEVEQQGIQTNIKDVKEKIEVTISDKDQIKETKTRLTRQLEIAKAELESEKKETVGLKKENHHLQIKVRKEKIYKEDLEHEIVALDMAKKDVQHEVEVVASVVDVVSASVRQLKYQNVDLSHEAKAKQEEVEEENERKEKELKELDAKFETQVDHVKVTQEKTKKKIAVQVKETQEEVINLEDNLETSKKAADKIVLSAKKLEKQNAVTAHQLELTQAEKLEMESKKRSLELELEKAQKYLQGEKLKTKQSKDKASKIARDTKKKERELEDAREKRSELEKMREDLEQSAELAKDSLADAVLHKQQLQENTAKLAETLNQLEDDLDRTEHDKDDAVHHSKLQHEKELQKIKKKQFTDTKSIDHKKKQLENEFNELNDELLTEEQQKNQLLNATKKLDDDVNQLAKRLKQEEAEKKELEESKKRLERELVKAKSYLEDDKKAKQKDEREKKRIEKEARHKLKNLKDSTDEERKQIDAVKQDLEGQLKDIETQLESSKKKKSSPDDEIAKLEKEIKKKKKKLEENEKLPEEDEKDKLKIEKKNKELKETIEALEKRLEEERTKKNNT